MTTRVTSSASLDARRRAAGLTIAEMARLAGVPYRRLWPTFAGGGPLDRDELARVELALDAAAGALPIDDKLTTNSSAAAEAR